MPGIPNRSQLQTDELQEFPITGPFGGTQSELPATEIEQLGFVDSTNVVFWKGMAQVRPGYTALPALPDGGPALGVADFYNANGVHIQTALTQNHLYQWIGSSQTWTAITGSAFGGSSTQLWGWDVVGYKLCFSQGTDPVWYWDGLATTYTATTGPASENLAEIDLHLMALNTVESGVAYPQRYHWSGAGNPTDWSSFDSGLNDELSNLGPGNGLIKLGQYGYGFHQNGIVQVVPTGVGTAPFDFFPIVNASIGDIIPKSLDHFDRDGVEQAVFASYDNVYIFNQASVIPIGDQPLDGRRRIGARSRILADLQTAGTNPSYGFVTVSINGNPFNAYWLFIPGVRAWVYNFDESNWTPFTYNASPQVAGDFQKASVPRIVDLIGNILGQTWTPASLTLVNPFFGFAIGFSNGTLGYVDFTNYSETPWRIIGPKHTFGDSRHEHTIKKFRLRVVDLGQVQYTITVTNQKGFSQTHVVQIGNGSGDILSAVVEFSVPGMRLQWTISGPVSTAASMVEFCPIYDTGGEQRGGSTEEPTVVMIS